MSGARPIVAPLWAIVAMDRNRLIGRGDDLPWRMPEDLKWFKQKTMGHSLVMGRKCFDALGRKPLPGRPCVVVTRDPSFRADNIRIAHTPADGVALARLLGEQPPFVIGGAQLYAALMPVTTRYYISDIPGEHAGDVFFPPMDDAAWREDGRWNAQTPGLVFRVMERVGA